MRTPDAESSHRLGELGLLACAFLLPVAFFMRSYDTTAVKTAVLQWGAVLMAFGWLSQGLCQGRFQVQAASWRVLLPALLYGAWAAARFAVASHRIDALPSAVNQAAMLTAYLAACVGFSGARAAFRCACLVLLAGWIVAAYALLQAFGVDPVIWRGVFGKGLLVHRAFSTLANPGFCASFLALLPPIALTLDQDGEAPRPLRQAALLLVPVSAAAALLTESAPGLCAFILISAAYGLLTPLVLQTGAAARRGLSSLLLAAATAGAAWGLGLLPSPRFEDGMALQRLTAASTLRMAAERPLIGHGTGAFAAHFPRFRSAELIRRQGSHSAIIDRADSAWLTVLVEQGLVGAALWLWLFGATLWTGLRGAAALRRAGALPESVYAAGFSAAAAGALVSSQFDVAWQHVAPGWLLWTLAGLGAGLPALAARRAVVSVLPLPVSEDVRRALHAPVFFAFVALAVPPALWLKADVDFNLGVYQTKRGRFEEAFSFYERIPRGSPRYATSLYDRGNIRLDQDRPDEALAYYRRLDETAPDFSLIHSFRARAHGALGDWTAAAAERARQAELDPLYIENLVAWAQDARSAGDLRQARHAVERAAAVAPEDQRVLAQAAANALMGRRLAAESRKRKLNGRGTARRPR